MILAAFVTFFSVALLLTHLSPTAIRRIVGYKGFVDLTLHGAVLWMFFGTSTMGLLQAEACAILFSIGLRAYHNLWGYERLIGFRWQRFPGKLTGRPSWT